MRIAVACDHAGYPLKSIILDTIRGEGHDALDLGTDSLDSVDYPDFVEMAGNAIQEKRVERCVLICGSGVGACIAANKMKGVYAATCHDTYSAHQGVEDDDMNILCLGGRVTGYSLSWELVQTFLNARFKSDERFIRRLKKISDLEVNLL